MDFGWDGNWWGWLIFGLILWGVFSNSGSCSSEEPHSRRRKRRSREERSEVEALKAELAASAKQIETLTARLNAVETIVTDDERELRKAFRGLEEKGA